jgi:hypothetical protein
MTKLSLVSLDVNGVCYKETKLAFGKAITEGHTSANQTVFIREYWAPLAVSFHDLRGFICIQITFSVDLKNCHTKVL